MSQFDGMPDNFAPQPPQPGMAPPQGMPPQGMPMQGPAMGQQGTQLDPAMIQQLLALQQQQGRSAVVNRQFALADKLRAGAPGMAKSSSQISTPNWAGALASGMANYKAGQLDRQGAATTETLGKERADAMAAYFDAIRGRGGAGGGGGGFNGGGAALSGFEG